jgi:putative oxidoreductase
MASSLPAIDAHRKYSNVASYLQSVVLLIIRLIFGYELVISASGHLHHVPDMVKNFTDWGVPLPRLNVYISAYTELIGGWLLMLGLAARLISLPLVFNFIVAYLTASKDTVHMLAFGPNHLDGVDKFFNDSAFNFLIAALVVLAFGPGRASIDYLLERTVFRRSKPAAT